MAGSGGIVRDQNQVECDGWEMESYWVNEDATSYHLPLHSWVCGDWKYEDWVCGLD